jgi:hypothetical protein
MHLKVSELASRYRFSVDAIYAWVKAGLIPMNCVLRVGNSIRIDSDQFDTLLRAGKLYRPRYQRTKANGGSAAEAARVLSLLSDQNTSTRQHENVPASIERIG